jgi:hypothetical protein
MDLLGGTTGQIVAARLPDGFAVAFGVRSGATWQPALTALLESMRLDADAVAIDGVAAMQIEPRGLGKALVLGTVGDWFVVGDGASPFGALAQRIQKPGTAADSADVAAALAAAGDGATMLQVARSSGDRGTVHQLGDRVVLRSRTSIDGMRTALGLPAAPTKTRPATPAAPTAAAPVALTGDHAELAAAEQAGANADPQVLVRLAASADAALASRATWLLGQHPGPDAAELLLRTAGAGHVVEARRHAMAALARRAPSTAVTTAIAGLDDTDRLVRTFAAQLLGKLRRPTAVAPLLALVDRARTQDDGAEPATDLQAAVLALHDLGAKEHLLPVATAVHDSRAQGTGECLAWWFQDDLPTLPENDQVTLLLAVLDHREPLLRRYAIGRLGELAPATAVKALEGRLAQEGPELRPLVEVALAHVRQDASAPPDNEADRAIANVQSMLATAGQRWAALDTLGKVIVGAGALAAALAFVVFLVLWNRRQAALRAAAAAAATSALIAPSDEYLAEVAAEAEALAVEGEYAAAEAEQAADDSDEPPAEAELAEVGAGDEPTADDDDRPAR